MPLLVVLLFAVEFFVTGAVADTVGETAQAISDGSYWIMRAVPPTLALVGGQEEERIGRRMCDAGLATAIVTELLKDVTNDDRPNDPQARDGFPSGHASAAWALAEATRLEKSNLAPYVYAFAAAVTWSRVELKEHTAAQALAGAALGYGIARLSASSHNGLFGGLIVSKQRRSPTETLLPEPTTPSLSLRRPIITVWEVYW
ncbi:MAG: phosphatase PAP2 family protein [Candidatus Zipacnadales bacterium]